MVSKSFATCRQWARVDHEDLAEGLRLVRRLFQTAPLKAATGGQALDPRAWDDDALGAWLQETCRCQFHPVGTLPHGDGPRGGRQLGDHGSQRHPCPSRRGRLSDAFIPRANTDVPTIMIAEHAAQLMREAVAGG